MDPRPPHRVSPVEITRAHRLQRPVEAKRLVALPLARRHHPEKAQEGQVIGRVTRDGGEPPHTGVARAEHPLRREALEQAPRGVQLPGLVVRDRETEPVGD